MKRLLNPACLALLLATAACGGGESESDENTGEANAGNVEKVQEAPPTDSLAYSMVRMDTLLGDCENIATLPACSKISLAYPEVENGATAALRDSVKSIVSSYIFDDGNMDSLLTRFKPVSLDSLGEDYKDMTGLTWELQGDITIMHNTPQLLALRYNTYAFTGGAHGNGSIIYFNLDPQNGSMYHLDDLLQAPELKDSLNMIAEQKFRKENNLGNQSFKTAGYWFQNNEFSLNDNFLIKEEGLRFLYNAYEITSYAAGTPTLTLSWEEVAGLIDMSKVPLEIQVNQ